MDYNDARIWHPWLRINRALRVMLHTRWSVEAWFAVSSPGGHSRSGARSDARAGLTSPTTFVVSPFPV